MADDYTLLISQNKLLNNKNKIYINKHVHYQSVTMDAVVLDSALVVVVVYILYGYLV